MFFLGSVFLFCPWPQSQYLLDFSLLLVFVVAKKKKKILHRINSVTFLFCSLSLTGLIFYPDTPTLHLIPGIASLCLWPLHPFSSQFNQYIQLRTEVNRKVSWLKREGLNASINCIPITFFFIEIDFRLQMWLIFFWNSQTLLLQIYFSLPCFKNLISFICGSSIFVVSNPEYEMNCFWLSNLK